MFAFPAGVPQFIASCVAIVVWYCWILSSFDLFDVGCVCSIAISHEQPRVVVADFAKFVFLLILVVNKVFVHGDVICNVSVVMPGVLSRFDFGWWRPSVCWCILSIWCEALFLARANFAFEGFNSIVGPQFSQSRF